MTSSTMMSRSVPSPMYMDKHYPARKQGNQKVGSRQPEAMIPTTTNAATRRYATNES